MQRLVTVDNRVSRLQLTKFFIKVFGKTTESTAKEKNTTPWINQILTVHLAMVKNKDLVHKSGQTAAHTMVIGA